MSVLALDWLGVAMLVSAVVAAGIGIEWALYRVMSALDAIKERDRWRREWARHKGALAGSVEAGLVLDSIRAEVDGIRPDASLVPPTGPWTQRRIEDALWQLRIESSVK